MFPTFQRVSGEFSIGQAVMGLVASFVLALNPAAANSSALQYEESSPSSSTKYNEFLELYPHAEGYFSLPLCAGEQIPAEVLATEIEQKAEFTVFAYVWYIETKAAPFYRDSWYDKVDSDGCISSPIATSADSCPPGVMCRVQPDDSGPGPAPWPGPGPGPGPTPEDGQLQELLEYRSDFCPCASWC